MWWRKEDPSSENTRRAKALSFGSGGRSQPTRRKQPIGRSADPPETEDPVVHVSETGSGIEVSFSDDIGGSPEQAGDPMSPSNNSTAAHRHRSGAAGSRSSQIMTEDVMSLQGQLARCQALHRAQFRVAAAVPPVPVPADPALEPSLQDFQPREHRVPLFGNGPDPPRFDDALFLLRSHSVEGELACVEEELAHLTAEIDALEQDRTDLHARGMQLPATTAGAPPPAWVDLHRRLAREPLLSTLERAALQHERGLRLTVALHHPPARDAFLSKCGAHAALLRQPTPIGGSGGTVVELGPENCRDGGAAATVQHIALLKSAAEAPSFFISKDKGKAFCWGLLPEKLFRRMKNAGYDPKHHASDIMYLATGPLGSYYAEFRNGECWWGTVSEDDGFHAICSDPSWDICRVAFGPCTVFNDKDGTRRYVTSWIILGRDGRTVWKNIPARLQNSLESRLANALACCEVALGSAGTYFVRFLDGTVDYCLPAAAAEWCRSLESRGGSVKSISLHPELSHDFVIRS